MSDIQIRRMCLEDVDAVHHIEVSTFPKPWERDAFEQEMTKNACARYMVALKDDKIVGFAGAWLVLDEGHITNIAVLESCRGQGIGRMLTTALMQYAANLGVQYMTLEVRRSNLTAQNLYTSLGFQRVGVRKKYYDDNGEDAFIMATEAMPSVREDFEEEGTVRE